MGYDLHITKAQFDWETKEFPISLSEWEGVATGDPDLRYATENYYQRRTLGGGSERIHPWLLVSHPEEPPLWFMDGAISCKNPDEATIRKMVVLAEKLGARVIGEEGETYDAEGQCTPWKPPAGEVEPTPAKRSFLKRWFGK